MRKYIATAPVSFHPGAVLLLSEAQAATRGHALQSLGDGRYAVQSPVQFKAGEEIGVAGDVPKALQAVLENPEVAQAKAAEKPSKPVKPKPAE